MASKETIVAPVTPDGESAISVIRVGGPSCESLARNIFPGTSLEPRKALLGNYRASNGIILDQVVFTFFKKDASYTGEPTLEISSHGNPFITRKILDDLLSRGCRAADPGEFTRLAFLNGKMDLTQVESVLEIIQARSDRALASANAKLSGVIKNNVNLLVEKVLRVVASLEAYIDFPEEGLPNEDLQKSESTLDEVIEAIKELISNADLFDKTSDGFRVVIVGAVNAGKSSFMNSFLGEDRVLVSEEPGTTRDFVESRISLGSHLINLVDTAGIREAGGPVEILGIEKTREQIGSAEFIFYVLDSTEPEGDSLFHNLDLVNKDNDRIIVIENKIDKNNSGRHPEILRDSKHYRVSALTGEGIKDFKIEFQKTLDGVEATMPKSVIMVNARQASALKKSEESIQMAFKKIKRCVSPELVVSDLRHALIFLAEITGPIDNETMLDELFSKFCIGK
ncbi:MAG: tRNA modification GTPase MnmE [Candidatus Moanabacter tarae]|uniref:tRNA modification GTPase MnmE n=1 Tax=Candidatus Moanibacter tarae TaxID=2200854 RepID=A0A2Z4AF08_9BACT|nr:MAG: tRNA modification GTPase MnmE [Candidatus Moanabacter tarae]|tara:strand:- start:1887 stop:3248 length:1362 start_codon:yes stop_codon:yes gene_type:complete